MYVVRLLQVSFVAVLPGVGLTKYTIRQVEPQENPHNVLASVTLYNTQLSEHRQ